MKTVALLTLAVATNGSDIGDRLDRSYKVYEGQPTDLADALAKGFKSSGPCTEVRID